MILPFLFCFALLSLYGDIRWNPAIVKHLKSAPGKGEPRPLPGVDFIYMINLDERPEKFADAAGKLAPYGIVPYRFSAVNGWQLSLETIDEVGLKYLPSMTPLMATTYPIEAKGKCSHEFMAIYGKTYFCHCMARGTVGIFLSHLSVLKDAWDSGYETIWVLEDDIEPLADPRLISDYIRKLDTVVGPEHWDVLFTDLNPRSAMGKHVSATGMAKRPDMDCSPEARTQTKYTVNKQVSPDFRLISARFGAYSMIIRRSGIEKMLAFAMEHMIFLPYDMENYLPENMARYSLTIDLVTNKLHALSDNGVPGHLQKAEEK